MVTNEEVYNLLLPHVEGRTQKELFEIVYLAHEAASRAKSKEKHVQLPPRPSRTGTEWKAYKDHMMDEEGVSNHADITLGFAWQALLADDEKEFRFQLDELFRTYSKQLPHARQQAENQKKPIDIQTLERTIEVDQESAPKEGEGQ